MPEGVELKLSCQYLQSIVGNTINKITIHPTGRYAKEQIKNLAFIQQDLPLQIEKIEVKGKFMYWMFKDYKLVMACTYGMTGQFGFKAGKHPCVSFDTLEGQEIYFNDPRHFGTIAFINTAELSQKLKELGWDAMQAPVDDSIVNYIYQKLSRSSKTIADALLDQKIFAGVGNYIRAEALYRCKMAPQTPAKNLDNSKIKELCQELVKVMQESYQYQGATFKTYQNVYGEEGKYSSLFQVYGQKQDPLGNKVITETCPGGRTIHWVPEIQELYVRKS